MLGDGCRKGVAIVGAMELVVAEVALEVGDLIDGKVSLHQLGQV